MDVGKRCGAVAIAALIASMFAAPGIAGTVEASAAGWPDAAGLVAAPGFAAPPFAGVFDDAPLEGREILPVTGVSLRWEAPPPFIFEAPIRIHHLTTGKSLFEQ